MPSTPASLFKKVERMERDALFQDWLERISAHPLNPSEQRQALVRIMTLTTQGRITATEARKLTKAVTASR